MKKYLIVIGIVIIYAFYLIGNTRVPIEEVDVIIGAGYDINRKDSNSVKYILPFSAYIYKSKNEEKDILTQEQESITKIGEGKSIGEAIQDKDLKIDKKYLQGLEKVDIIGEEYARYGINNFIDESFRNPEVNDKAYVIVCKGKSDEYLTHKIEGYSSSSDYMYDLIENIQNSSFFSDNYKLIDMFVRIKSEGRQVVLPYAELTNTGIQISGLALFQEDKMAEKIDIKDAKILNLLRENNVKGMLSLQKSPTKYIDFYAKSKGKKVKCHKEGDKFIFDIDLNLVGDIVSNTLYDGIMNKVEVKKKFEDDMGKHVENMCYKFIEKMQHQYKKDCIELGTYGAGTFGRRKDIDWNEVVSNAKINVNVKVKVDKQGRGDY